MKIKIAMLTNGLTVNGISNVIKNYCVNIDLQKIEMTLLAGAPIDKQYAKLYKRLGIELIELPNRQKNTFSYYWRLFNVLKGGGYDIFHVHGNSVNSVVELFIAFLTGIRVRIFHSHNTICNNPKLHKILIPFFRGMCTDGFACGEKAGEWIFGKNNFHVIANGFNTEEYRFNTNERIRIRKELNIEEKYVIGHVGRINYQKNQLYLIDVFKEVAAECAEAVLLLVGTGPYYDKVVDLVNQNPYKDRIILYGETNETTSMYSAMDVLVFPSHYEGLPVVLLEAQMTGLLCIASDKITEEMDFGDIKWLSIDEKPEVWAHSILNIEKDTEKRHDYYDKKYEMICKYQIDKNVQELEAIYVQMFEREYGYK